MELTPEEYGIYWAGAVRLATGVLVVILVWAAMADLIAHPDLPARALGWVIVGLAVLVGSFVATLGVARVVRGAIRQERRT